MAKAKVKKATTKVTKKTTKASTKGKSSDKAKFDLMTTFKGMSKTDKKKLCKALFGYATAKFSKITFSDKEAANEKAKKAVVKLHKENKETLLKLGYFFHLTEGAATAKDEIQFILEALSVKVAGVSAANIGKLLKGMELSEDEIQEGPTIKISDDIREAVEEHCGNDDESEEEESDEENEESEEEEDESEEEDLEEDESEESEEDNEDEELEEDESEDDTEEDEEFEEEEEEQTLEQIIEEVEALKGKKALKTFIEENELDVDTEDKKPSEIKKEIIACYSGDEEEEEEPETEDEETEEAEESEQITEEDLIEADFNQLCAFCSNSQELTIDSDDFSNEEEEELRAAMAKELGFKLPKAGKKSKGLSAKETKILKEFDGMIPSVQKILKKLV